MLAAGKLAQPKLGLICQRPRLHQVFDQARERPVVWVAGPAGSGKSTAVASYVEARQLPCLWYEVDARDDDAASLFHFLDDGVRPYCASGLPSLPPLASDDPEGALGFARKYFEALFARLKPPFCLVFDDCHVLPVEHRWYQLLREGLSTLPAGFNVFLLSRGGLPPLFSRLLAQSHVSLVGWEQLRFAPSEAEALIRARAGSLRLELEDVQVQALASRADGWAAGLVLALERARLDPTRLLSGSSEEALTGPELFDFFVAEVFAGVPIELRQLLMKSALLPMMTAELLEPLVERHDVGELLLRLERDNFFATEYAGPSALCYRFHPLFRAFLLARLKQEVSADELARLRRKAGQLLAAVGEVEAAFDLYEQAGDDSAAAMLVMAEAPRLMSLGRSRTIAGWVARLPVPLIASEPWLGFWAGTAKLETDPLGATVLLGHSLQQFDLAFDSAGYWTTWCGLVQAYAFAGEDFRPLDGLVMQSRDALARGYAYPSAQIEARALGALAMAMALREPDHPDLSACIERMRMSLHRDPEELWIAALVLGYAGKLSRLSLFLDDWQSEVEQRQGLARVFYSIAQAVHATYRGDFVTCLQAAAAGREEAERLGAFAAAHPVRMSSGFALLHLGRYAELEAVIQEISRPVRGREQRLAAGSRHLLQSILALAKGEPVRAALDARISLHHATELGMPMACVASRLALAEALLFGGQSHEGASQLLQARTEAKGVGPSAEQGAALVHAAFALASGNTHQAAELIEYAFAEGARWCFVPVAWPARHRLTELCRYAIGRGIQVEYARTVVARLGLPLGVPGGSAVALPTSRDVPAAFAAAIRAALKSLHEQRRLTESPLLDSWLVRERTPAGAPLAERIVALQRLLRERVQTLSGNARTEPLYQALHHTFIEPAGNQVLAADRAGMSFGTYRRHLAAGLAEVATALWLYEQDRAQVLGPGKLRSFEDPTG